MANAPSLPFRREEDGRLVVIDESGETVVKLRATRVDGLASLSAETVGCWRTQTIRAAARLGVLDALPAPRGAAVDTPAARARPVAAFRRVLAAVDATQR